MPSNTPEPMREPGSYAFEGLERLIHEKARLSIIASLAANPDGLIFTELRALCSLTDGNLSRQLQFLEAEGMVDVRKGVHNNRPQTLCRLTTQGRERFLDYVAELENVVASAQHKTAKSKAPKKPRGEQGFGRAVPSF